jgi:alanyl-tRNA synthetase
VEQTGEIGLFLFAREQGISAGTRRVEALTGEAAVRRAQEDQTILEELEETAKSDRRSLVDEYAKLRDQLKAVQRENERLRMKAATASGDAASSDILRVGETQVWTPRFEGLDSRAHAQVVDEWRNKNRERPFVVLSTAVQEGEKGVHVISAVSESLKDRVKAPEVMKRLGLRGGGRPDFAQGGGVAPGEVDALRRKATELARQMLEGAAVAD